jgi:hypothetical protein
MYDHAFIFQLNAYGYSHYVRSSLTRGRISRLKLLLDLVSTVVCYVAHAKTTPQLVETTDKQGANLQTKHNNGFAYRKGEPMSGEQPKKST